MKYECTEERFLRDVARHEMSIIRDDDLYRHIRFKRPDSTSFYFDLITWPGHLCFTGDMGTNVFSRIEDMFSFFRTDREEMRLRDGQTLAINPSYWGEKLLSESRFGGYREFDEKGFEQILKERIIQWIKDHRDSTSKDERRELWDAFTNEVLGADGDSGGYRKQAAAYDFHHRIGTDRFGDPRYFGFADCWEYDFKRYTFHYIWCCYALAWGVKKYDKAKAGCQCKVTNLDGLCVECGKERDITIHAAK